MEGPERELFHRQLVSRNALAYQHQVIRQKHGQPEKPKLVQALHP
jgi:hypothetical protein